MYGKIHWKFAAVVCLGLLLAPACFVRKRVIAPPPGQPQNRRLLTATKPELIDRIHAIFDPIQNFSIRADLSPSVGSIYTGTLTDYATIRAYILFTRPDDIRVVGLDPIVHSSTIFDMVSVGNDFRVSIPSKNAFIEGANDAPPKSKNKLENLRPEAFLHALIVEPPAPGDFTVFEDDTDETTALYIILILHQENGQLLLARSIAFDRYTLEISREVTFNAEATIISETRYQDWKPFGTISYPSTIKIRRPLDGYEMTIDVLEMKANSPEVTADKFVLEQPSGTKLTVVK
ncbi:MAG TPA: hypothetical protein VMG40_10050 [Bryobacteraceae bacterium]|nr:hypothetical protein [Bryobacteraceae bacterium]